VVAKMQASRFMEVSRLVTWSVALSCAKGPCRHGNHHMALEM
jgi:hypothetical protein